MRHWQASNAKVVFISPSPKLQHSDTHAPKKQNTTKCQKRKTSHPEIQFPHIIFPEMWKLLPSLDELRRKEQFEGERYIAWTRQCITSMLLRLLCLWLYRSSRSSKRVWGAWIWTRLFRDRDRDKIFVYSIFHFSSPLCLAAEFFFPALNIFKWGDQKTKFCWNVLFKQASPFECSLARKHARNGSEQ